jgi:hypothetical protein
MGVVPFAQNLVGEASREFLVEIDADPHRPSVGIGGTLVRLPDWVPRQVGHGDIISRSETMENHGRNET